jgi:hypothetical protein
MERNDLPFLSATELARLIEKKQVSPVAVVEAYLERINGLNSQLNAFLRVCPDEALQAKETCDAKKCTEVLVCLSSESREQVGEIVRKAVTAGGTTYNEPHDHGFMYGHGFQDLDGHILELIYMEPSSR